MALYLRGNVWWFEIRTKLGRVQKSTGFKKKDKKQAKAVFDAARLAHREGVSRSMVEGILRALYRVSPQADDKDTIALTSIDAMYEQWKSAKGRTHSRQQDRFRRTCVSRFVEWATSRNVTIVSQVSASVAREYAVSLRMRLSNKSQRNVLATLGGVWRAIGDTVPGVHNPWHGAIPDKDGSSVRRGCFTPAQEGVVLAECERAGHGWRLASMISRYTALRYGDVARLDWSQIDMDARTIAVTPSKTARHGIRLTLPIVDALWAELVRVEPEKRIGWVLPAQAALYPKTPKPDFGDILRACGLDPKVYTFHSWRHTCASRLSESGASVEMLRRFGGWTSDRMAEHYDHAERLAEMRAAMERTKAQ